MHDMLNRVLPKEILRDHRLDRGVKYVYLAMRAHPKTTISGLAEILNLPYNTVHRCLVELQDKDWVYPFRRRGVKSKLWVPWMPLELEHHLAAELRKVVDMAPYRGEKLLKCLLDIIVDDDAFYDNARPEWTALVPGEAAVEFDRYYWRCSVAIEFHGRQHYKEVTFLSGKSDLRRQTNSDARRALACLRQGVTLIEIADVELSYEQIVAKLEGHLPLIPPLTHRPLYLELANMCRSHVNWVVDKHGTE